MFFRILTTSCLFVLSLSFCYDVVKAGESVSASIKVTAFVVESTGLVQGEMIQTDKEQSPFDTFLIHRSLSDNQSLQLSWVYPDNRSELIETTNITSQQIHPSLSLLTFPKGKEGPSVLQIIYTDN